MQFIIMLILMLIMDLTRPVPKPPARPGLGDFQAPTAEQDRAVPVFWGQPWLAGPNLVWYGDLRTKKITKKVKGTFVDKKQTIGYRYYLGMHLAFGYGDENTTLKEIWIGGTDSVSGGDQVWAGSLVAGDGYIDKDGLWGGEESGGGVSGTFTWMNGGRAQGQNYYLRRVLGARVPAWRGVCGLSWNQGYHGTQTVIQNWACKIQRLPRLLGSAYWNINEEANAAEIQYELLTNSDFGMGLTADEIDVASFRACAKTIYDDKLGLSLVWDNTKSLEEILKEVDRHVDSLTYINPNNGKWTMRMVRNDYNVDDLRAAGMVANKSNAQLIKFQRPTADELVNEVIVTFSADSYQGKTIPVRVQDTAAFANRDNQRITSTLSYPGFTKQDLAKQICSRDLRALSYPFARIQLKLDRKFFSTQPVDRLLFDWEFPDGEMIQNMPLIILERDIGTLVEGEITVTCAQDIFGLGQALYTEGGGSGWVPVDRSPKAPVNYRMEFTPYWLMKLDPNISDPLSAIPMLMVEEPTATSLSFTDLYSDPSTGGQYLTDPESQPFTPTATLVYDYLETAGADTGGTLILDSLTGQVTVPTAAVNDVRYLAGGLVVIDNEIMAFTSAVGRADGTWAVTGVQRGLLDTPIERHLAGARAWFISDSLARTPTQLSPFASGTYRAKLITNAMNGSLDSALAPTLSISTNGSSQNARPLYAYPVRDLKVNGSSVPSRVPANLISVTWSHSNKEAEGFIFFHGDTPPAKPGDTTYVVYLYDDTGVLKAQSGPLVGTAHSFAVGDVVGGLPTAGYVQVATINSAGSSARATLWFGREVDYAATQDAGPQRLLDEAGPWSFIRMAD